MFIKYDKNFVKKSLGSHICVPKCDKRDVEAVVE